MIGAPRTVLLVEDDEAARLLHERALPTRLPEFSLATAANGAEALALLAERPVEVLVSDLHMPVMNGFELLAHVRGRYPNLGVVVLSNTPSAQVAHAAPQLATYRRVTKPVPPAVLAEHVRAAAAERVRGHLAAATLAPLLTLLQLERSTCALLIRSGARKGRLHFLAGELVNAYAFELGQDGEVAARHILAWDRASVQFERSLHNHVRTIHTPLEELMLDVARTQDEARPRAPGTAPAEPAPGAAPSPATAGPSSPVDASLAALESALADLRQRAGDLETRLQPTLAETRRAADAPLRPLDPPTEPTAVDARLVELAHHLADRARILGEAVLPAAKPAT